MIKSRDFPYMRFLPTPWFTNAATLGPIGRIPHAPGTWGSLAGLAWYGLVFHFMPWPLYLIMWALTLYLAMAISNEAEKRFQQRDPGKIVIDEFVAIPGCFLFLPPAINALGGWPLLLGGFILFRVFDIVKPLWVDRFQAIPGGVGVVMDDVMAAITTSVLLHAIVIILAWSPALTS